MISVLDRPELDRLRAAAAARGVVVGDGVRAAALLWLRQHPTAAGYTAMAESYEDAPLRREELAGEPFIAPSAMREDPPQPPKL